MTEEVPEDFMAINLKEDAFVIMNIIKIAEKDIENGDVKKADDVFKNLRQKLIQEEKRTI